MTKNDIQPVGGNNPVWPVAVRDAGNMALPAAWGQQSYGSGVGLDLNLATIWRVISEWRWLILGMVVTAVAGSIIVTLLTTPLYRATATLELNPPQVEVMEDDTESRFRGAGDSFTFLSTQYGLLKSRNLAERVAQSLNLASNSEVVSQEGDRGTRQRIATGVLVGNFTVKPVPESRLVEISYSSPNPQLAAQITNSFADNFIESNLQRRYESSSYARDFLQRQITKVKGELERSERQLVGYAQKQQIINTAGSDKNGAGGDTNSLQGASLVALNQALAAAQTRRIAAEQKYRQAGAAGDPAEVASGTSLMRQQLAGLQAEYEEKLTSFKPDYPDMVRLRSRIEALQQGIRREAGTVAGARRGSLLADYQAALAEEQSIQARVNQLRGSVLNLRGRSIEYNILQREVDTNRTIYEGLLERYKKIGVAGGIGTNLVSVVDRAEPPGGPYKPNLILNLLAGLGLGLVLGVASALALEFINDTVKNPDDVRDKLQLASLGVIPKKKGQGSLAEELEDQTSAVSEAYYSLRTSLQFSTEHGAPKSLLVTSTRAAEGKSSTTLALAQNFARLGNSVLLIDADLRKPAFVTGAEEETGLSKLLTNSEPLRKHALKTNSENLWLIPCGQLPPNPAELLASARLRAIIAEAVNEFDMVIVDGPPVLGLADAPLLGAVCEGTLMVIESGKTRTRAAVDAINRLKAAGSHVLGAVLTKYRAQGGGYGYGYAYEPYRYGGVSSREREIQLITTREA
jgi:capsular exopolysaccharide synthesis family protein